MKLKRFTAIFVLVAMMASMMFGCANIDSDKTTAADKTTDAGTQGDETTTQADQTTEGETLPYNVEGLPIVNEPVTIKIITQDKNNPNTGNETDKSKIWAWLEEKTGIHIEVESYPAEELKSKLPLIMSTPDEMPDMFFYPGLSAADVMNYGVGGQLLELTDLIEQYAPNILECWNTEGYDRGAAVSADGNIYMIPYYTSSFSSNQATANNVFLETLNMEWPTTWEGLYDVFKAIQAHGDANNDGIKNNEYCWSATLSQLKSTAYGWAGLKVYYPRDGIMFDNNGNDVFFVNTSERYREMLTWLNKFYEEGMLDPEVFTQTSAEARAKWAENRAFVKAGTASDPESAGWNGVQGDFYPVPLVLNEGDTPIVPIGANYEIPAAVIAANTEYPEICMLLINYLYGEEGAMVSTMGMEGVDFTVESTNPLVVKPIDDTHGAGSSLSEYAVPVPSWKRAEWIQPATTKTTINRQEIRNTYKAFGFQNYVTFTAEEADAIAISSADLGKLCDDYFVGFINGTYDIEKDWDKYVAECEKMQAKEITAYYQTAYNRYYDLD